MVKRGSLELLDGGTKTHPMALAINSAGPKWHLECVPMGLGARSLRFRRWRPKI